MPIYAGSSANQLKGETQHEGTCNEQCCTNVVYRRGLCRRQYEQLRETERQKQEAIEAENDAILREMFRKAAWREHLPPVVHTSQEELDVKRYKHGQIVACMKPPV